jgi:hypothetical protein
MERRDIKRVAAVGGDFAAGGRVEAKHLRNLHVSCGG